MTSKNEYSIQRILYIIKNYKSISIKQQTLLNIKFKYNNNNYYSKFIQNFCCDIKNIYNELIYLYNEHILYLNIVNISQVTKYIQICNKNQIELYYKYNSIINISPNHCENIIKLQQLYGRQVISPIITEQLLLQVAFPKLAEINNI